MKASCTIVTRIGLAATVLASGTRISGYGEEVGISWFYLL
jgi:hypothetical protein